MGGERALLFSGWFSNGESADRAKMQTHMANQLREAGVVRVTQDCKEQKQKRRGTINAMDEGVLSMCTCLHCSKQHRDRLEEDTSLLKLPLSGSNKEDSS